MEATAHRRCVRRRPRCPPATSVWTPGSCCPADPRTWGNPSAAPAGHGQASAPQQPYAPYGQPPGYQPPARPPYVPNQRFTPAAGPGYVPPGSGPRLNVPQRPGLNPNYVQPENANFNGPPGAPQAGMRPTRPGRVSDEYDDAPVDDGLFDEPAPSLQRPTGGRRPSPVDYQQAYRDAEAGFEDEAPRSKLPWVLPLILAIGALLALGLVWGYLTIVKPMMNGTQQANTQQNSSTNNDVPVVPAPTQPDKAQPDQTQQTNAAAGATRKQIYDRIVGDKEVLGGQMVPTEQAPAAQDGAGAVPQPTDATGAGTGGAAAPAQGGDAVPLPIPPPPGDNTQGALPDKPEDPNKQSAEIVTPAAGESQAAVAVPAPGEIAPPPAAPGSTGAAATDPNAVTAISAASPPAPSDTQAVADDAAATPQAEQITPAKPKAETPKKVAEVATPKKPKKLPKDKLANLGAKPVVLVPPSGKAKAASPADVTVASTDTGGADGGLYGNNYVVDTPATTDAASTTAAPKKKKTLADLFNGTSGEDAAAQTGTNSAPVVNEPATPAPAIAAKPVAPKPAPVQQASAGTGGVVAQLASFRTSAEASAEFSRLKAKYGATLSGLSPIVNQADVAGTTRYRLAVGPFSSRDQANALCSKLFAAGERDCLVRN